VWSSKRTSAHGCFVEVLDRVLEKGLVIDAAGACFYAGIQVIGVEARVVVASIPTYLKVFCDFRRDPTAARPAVPASRSRTAVLTPRRSGQRSGPTRRIRALAARCEHGCTFTLSAARRPSRVACPFDGSRACALIPAPAA